MSDEKFLWVEKYRPSKVKDCILPEILKKPFQAYVDSKTIPNLILSGTSGVGKTTIAIAMCEEIGADYILINGSTKSGIDTLRVEILGFATSVSFKGGRKVIIVDEADNLTLATQLGLRGVIEEVSDNCSFIFTCNFVNKIKDAIHSRCPIINFNKMENSEKMKMASLFLKRIEDILVKENISYDKKVLIEVIMKFFPDYRRVLGELQHYASTGSIDEGILSKIKNVEISNLISLMKVKNFKEIRKWVGENSDADSIQIMRDIYDELGNIIKPQSIPIAVVHLANYQYKAAFVVDQEINLMALLTEILVDCEFI